MNDSPLEIAGKYSHGITYPCDKETLVEVFARNGAPSDAVAQLRAAPYERFTQPSEILAALWNEKRTNPFRGDVTARSPWAGRGTKVV